MPLRLPTQRFDPALGNLDIGTAKIANAELIDGQRVVGIAGIDRNVLHGDVFELEPASGKLYVVAVRDDGRVGKILSANQFDKGFELGEIDVVCNKFRLEYSPMLSSPS